MKRPTLTIIAVRRRRRLSARHREARRNVRREFLIIGLSEARVGDGSLSWSGLEPELKKCGLDYEARGSAPCSRGRRPTLRVTFAVGLSAARWSVVATLEFDAEGLLTKKYLQPCRK